MKKLIITADDFGLSQNINTGIVAAYQSGMVTAASLLINAPATDQAISLALQNPGLEIGLHLGIVESFSTSQNRLLLTSQPYWPGPCLPRDWKEFLRGNYLLQTDKWFHEFELQIKQFQRAFKKIPFLNSTQHLHLLPCFQPLIRELCFKFEIPFLRVGRKLVSSGHSNLRPIQSTGIMLLSKWYNTNGLKTVDCLLGSDQAGHLNHQSMLKLLDKVPEGLSELIVHPGLQDDELKAALPATYSNYGWENELEALTSEQIRQSLSRNIISLTNFSST